MNGDIVNSPIKILISVNLHQLQYQFMVPSRVGLKAQSDCSFYYIIYIYEEKNSIRISTITSLLIVFNFLPHFSTQQTRILWFDLDKNFISDDISSLASLKGLKIKFTDQVKEYLNDLIMKSHHGDKKHLKKIFSGVYSIDTCYYRGQLSPKKIF